MISERTFARSFSGFWAELLPLLTPSFVHIINEVFKEHLTDEFGIKLEPLAKNTKVRDFSIVAEFAFFLAEQAIKSGDLVDEVFSDERSRKIAERSALDIVKKYEGGKIHIPNSLELEELNEGLALAKNYERFINEIGINQSIEFSPTIPGAGFLAQCKADISIGETLFEVKTVDRNLSGKDIRQLFIYLSLQFASGQRRWKSGGFFNPRRSVYHKFEVDDLIERLTGGRSSVDVFQDLIDFVSKRDIQLDNAF